jgi:hypothetical protein
MFSMSQAGGGSSPVWVTILCARLVGGFAGGFLSYTVLRAAEPAAAAGTHTPAVWTVALAFTPVVVAALVTGLAISTLLPSISGRTVGLGNAVLAAFAGSMVPLIAGIVLIGSAAHASPGSLLIVAGAGLFVSIAMQILGVAVTTWMVSAASTERERWRGRVVAPNPSWSSIESIDQDGAGLEEDQAERGYWGSMTGPDQPDR